MKTVYGIFLEYKENTVLDLNKCCDQSSSLGNFHLISAVILEELHGKGIQRIYLTLLVMSDGKDNVTGYFSIA